CGSSFDLVCGIGCTSRPPVCFGTDAMPQLTQRSSLPTHLDVSARAAAREALEEVHGDLGPWERHITTATWLFVALGIALRLIRYLLHFPLWGDETMAAANFLDRGYADLLKPLDYGQSC